MRVWTLHTGAERTLVRVRRRDPIIAPSAKRRQDRDNGKMAYLRHYLANVSKFIELREAVKAPLGVHKLRIICIAHTLEASANRVRVRECDR